MLFFLALALVHSYALGQIQVETPIHAIELCDSEVKTFTIIVKNPQPHPVSVLLAPVDVANSHVGVSIIPANDTLMPNESKEFYGVVSAKSREYGEYAFFVEAQTQDVRIKKPVSVVLKNCHELRINADAVKKEVCLFTSDEFEIIVENTGAYDEILNVSVSGSGAEFAKLSKEGTNALVIPRKESRKLFLFFYPSEKTGNFSLVVDIANTYVQQSIKLETGVSRCSDFKAYAPPLVSVCENQNLTFNLLVQNTGITSDNYALRVVAPPGVHVENNTLTLASGSAQNVSVTVPPACDEQGTYDATFFVSAKNAVGEQNTTTRIVVDDCYSFNALPIPVHNATACAPVWFNMSLTNTGAFEQSYEFSSDAKELNISKPAVFLQPNQTTVIPLVYASCALGTKDMTIFVRELSVCNTTAALHATVGVVSAQEAIKARITPAQENYILSVLEHYNVPLILENQGFQSASYTLEFSGSAGSWVHARTPGTIMLAPGELLKANLIVIPPQNATENAYELVVNAFSEDTLVGSAKILFSRQNTAPQIIGYVTSNGNGAERGYLILIILLVFGVLAYHKRGRLVRFLRRDDANTEYEKTTIER